MLRLKVGDKIIDKNGAVKVVMYTGVEEDEAGNKLQDIRVLNGIVKIPNNKGRLQSILSVSKQNVYPEILDEAIVRRNGIVIFGYKTLFLNLFEKIKRKILHIF